MEVPTHEEKDFLKHVLNPVDRRKIKLPSVSKNSINTLQLTDTFVQISFLARLWQDVETIMLMEVSHFNACANVFLNHYFPLLYILQLLESLLN